MNYPGVKDLGNGVILGYASSTTIESPISKTLQSLQCNCKKCRKKRKERSNLFSGLDFYNHETHHDTLNLSGISHHHDLL